MARESKKPKAAKADAESDDYGGPERRVHSERRRNFRRDQERRYAPRRLDERRSAGIGEVMDERRRTDRRNKERRRTNRRKADRRTPPPGRRKRDLE